MLVALPEKAIARSSSESGVPLIPSRSEGPVNALPLTSGRTRRFLDSLSGKPPLAVFPDGQPDQFSVGTVAWSFCVATASHAAPRVLLCYPIWGTGPRVLAADHRSTEQTRLSPLPVNVQLSASPALVSRENDGNMRPRR